MIALLFLLLAFQPCEEIDTSAPSNYQFKAGDRVLAVDVEIWSGTFDDVKCTVIEQRADGLFVLRPDSQAAYYSIPNPPDPLCMTGPPQEYVVAANPRVLRLLRRR